MLIDLHPDNPDPRKMNRVIDILKKDGVVIIPTDTVYSFACSLQSAKGIAKIAQLKGIKPEKARFSIIFSDLSNLSEYTRSVNSQVFKLLKRAFPGPYTIILFCGSKIPKAFHNNRKTVGIRIPDHPIALELVRQLGQPIVVSSVLDDDEILEYTTDPELIHERYEKKVDAVVDSGYGRNVPSTVIDCTGDEPELIREGIGPADHVL